MVEGSLTLLAYCCIRVQHLAVLMQSILELSIMIAVKLRKTSLIEIGGAVQIYLIIIIRMDTDRQRS